MNLKLMKRFSIDNRFRRVRGNEFKGVAQRLENYLKEVRPTISSELLCTTNGEDYHGYGSLTIMHPETEKAMERREKHKLEDLDEDLWMRSYKTGLYIKDNTTKEPYMIVMSVGEREPRKLIFYGQAMDSKSEEVFDSFKKANLFQKIGDGFGKTSDFSRSYMLGSLGIK